MEKIRKNQLDPSEVFNRYIVDDTPEHWHCYPGLTTGVEIIPSKKPGEYHCKISFVLKKKKEVMAGSKTYKNIFTAGRCEFQEFAEEFELMQEDDRGESFLNLQELCNRYCTVYINSKNTVRALSAAEFSKKDKTAMEISRQLEAHSQECGPIDLAALPEAVLRYHIIAMTEPYDAWQPDTEYHAIVKGVTAEKSNRANDYNVKVSAYVFNGNHVKVMAKYYNGIYSGGKAAFDEFCHKFGMVNKDGSISVQEAEDTFCCVVLYANSKGNLYIDEIEPMEVPETSFDQYDMVMDYSEAARQEYYSQM